MTRIQIEFQGVTPVKTRYESIPTGVQSIHNALNTGFRLEFTLYLIRGRNDTAL